MEIKDLIKEVNTINLGENGFLVIKCGEEISRSALEAISRNFNTFMDGKLNGRVIVVRGDVEFTKVEKPKER